MTSNVLYEQKKEIEKHIEILIKIPHFGWLFATFGVYF